jgi:hypothetical protein
MRVRISIHLYGGTSGKCNKEYELWLDVPFRINIGDVIYFDEDMLYGYIDPKNDDFDFIIGQIGFGTVDFAGIYKDRQGFFQRILFEFSYDD